MEPAHKIIAVFAIWLIGVYIYSSILPYHFSRQKPIPQDDMNGNYNFDEVAGVFHGKQVESPAVNESALAAVLGQSDSGDNKRIEIDLTNQRLYAFEGDEKVFDFLVSTGKWGKTPTGEFRIWIKLRATKMSGGSRALHTYYYLPNVPYVMYFSNNQIPAARGFGIHGTYWHNNFGHPMSHGCINMKTEEAQQLYYWANPKLGEKQSIRATQDNLGTKIIIYGQSPAN